MGRLQAIRFIALILVLPALATAEGKPKNAEPSFFERSKKEVSRLIDFFSRSWVDEAKPDESRGRGIQVQSGQTVNPLELIQQSRTTGDGQTERGDVVQNGQVVEPDKEEKRPPQGNPTGGPPPKSGRAQTSPYWLPYCFLIDPANDPAIVNQNIKKIVDEYGACGIAVEPFAFTIAPGYPQDYQELNQRARQACDFGRAFVVRGAIQMMTASNEIPGQMCGENGAPGCSTLCERLSVSQLTPNANAVVALHESLHSNCCGRLCVNEGEGTTPVGYAIELALLETPVTRMYHAEPTRGESPRGPLNDAPEGGEGGDIGGGGGGPRPPDSLGGTLPPEVCATLREGAAPNDGTHRWDPNKRNFYARATDPAAQKPLDGRSFFAPKPRNPPGSDHPAGATANEGGGNTGGGAGRIGFDDSKAKNGQANGTSTAGGATAKKDALTEALLAVADGRHRGIPVDGATTSLLKGLKATEQRGDPAGTTQFTNPLPQAPPAPSGGGGAGRIGFDDSRKKGANLVSGGRSPASAGSAATGPAMGPGGGAGGIGFGDGSGGGGGAYGGGSDDFTRIIGAGQGVGGNSLDGNFFQSIGQGTEVPAEEPRQRGGSLRDRDQAALKRDSQTFQKRTDVLTSSRPDPNRAVDTTQPPMPGTY